MKHIPDRKSPILIVDDDKGFLLTIKEILLSAGMPEPALISDPREVIPAMAGQEFQFVLLDLIMPHMSGLDLLRNIKAAHVHTQCVIVTASDDISSAVGAMKVGAYDYLTKPLQYEKLIILIKRAGEQYWLRQGLSLYERQGAFAELQRPDAFDDMVAVDRAMARVLRQVEMVAPTDYSVVITGESGTGKEMIARKIHALSNRSAHPFVALNMGAVSDTLFKDELFGHKKGAYTGASVDKKGFFETARGGTLFLDEIADLDISLQSGLLRVIQEKEFYQVGSTATVDVDVRILAATNKDIPLEIEGGRFRADLFHRLNMFHIHLPPLRQRREDVLPLAHLFLDQFSKETGKALSGLTPDLETHLLAYGFPGNVRELKNMLAKGVLMEKGDTLGCAAMDMGMPQAPAPISHGGAAMDTTRLTWPLARVEQDHILRVLDSVDHNQTRAAKILGIGRKTLHRKLKTYGTPRDNGS